MQKFTSSFLQEAEWRGFLHQGTNFDGLDEVMAKGKIAAYIGFDATAKSLHIGSLMQIMWLRLLQKHGHKPIVLMGDGTTLIGDPSGKDAARQMLTKKDIDENIQSIQEIFTRYLHFGTGENEAILVRNGDWLSPLNYIDFLRNIGCHFSINRMLTFDSVRLRLEREQPLSFLEFNYMLLQAYDFWMLSEKFDCSLQLGGSDQWGNIINGIDLIRRKKGKEAYGLTAPLLTTSEGTKMGKTAKGAIWLRPELLPPFEFWQFWRNIHDDDVSRFLRLFTDLTLEEIKQLEILKDAEINQAKKVLADEVTRLCHGEDTLINIHETIGLLFEGEEGNLKSLINFKVNFSTQEQGHSIIKILKDSGLVDSLADARRLIRGKGARLDGHLIEEEGYLITEIHFKDKNNLKLSAGKKKHIVLECSSYNKKMKLKEKEDDT